MRILVLSISIFLHSAIDAQVLNQCHNNEIETVIETIIGDGLDYSNVTLNGFDCSVAVFDGTFRRGFDSGIILSTDGLNESGSTDVHHRSGIEPDLSKQLEMVGAPSSQLYNVITLEFDFVPSSDKFEFEYLFASNEYPNFTCSRYNDIFGFFLSGPGIQGPFSNDARNIALIPNPHIEDAFTDTPVIINAINSGESSSFDTSLCDSIDTNWRDYYVFYVDNLSRESIMYLGHTSPLKSSLKLIPCETYHIKLAIADCGDGLLNSAVYLRENSFQSSWSVEYSVKSDLDLLYPNDEVSNHKLYEGCGSSYISFKTPENVDDSVTFQISVSGSSSLDSDYSLATSSGSILSLIEFNPKDSLIIHVHDDSLIETTENLIVSIQPNSYNCEELIYDSIVFEICDQPELFLEVSEDLIVNCKDQEIVLEAEARGGVSALMDTSVFSNPYNFHWMDLGDGRKQFATTDVSKEYCVEVQGLCEQKVSDCVFVQVHPESELVVRSDSVAVCEGQKGNMCVNIHSGNGDYRYGWSNGSSDSCITEYTGTYEVIVEDACGNIVGSTGEIYRTDTIQPSFNIKEIIHTDQMVILENNSSYVENAFYNWDFGDDLISDSYLPEPHYYEYPGDYYISLSISDENFDCSKETGKWVRVIPSYNFFAPNSFTPNNDGVNDTFKPQVSGFDSFELFIYDRWGNEVYYTRDMENYWDGTNNLIPVSEGIYVYKITVTDHHTETIHHEHGTITLFR